VAPSQPRTPAAQNPPPASSSTPSGSQPNSAAPTNTPKAKSRRRKKTIPTCATATSPAQPDASATNHTGSQLRSTPGTSTQPGSTSTSAAQLPPCPPPKKVIRNGGSTEPSIQLSGGTVGEQASQQRSTEELTAASQENLKKIAGLQLTASQQETVSQIKQFMQQSKMAVAAGDAERGHNLAMKARLLSDELLKP
jgi:hypothetical protein